MGRIEFPSFQSSCNGKPLTKSKPRSMEPGKINENRFELFHFNSQLISWQFSMVISTLPRISEPVNVDLASYPSMDGMVIHASWIVEPFRRSGVNIYPKSFGVRPFSRSLQHYDTSGSSRHLRAHPYLLQMSSSEWQ